MMNAMTLPAKPSALAPANKAANRDKYLCGLILVAEAGGEGDAQRF
jgi:hypothetical protein